MLTSLIGLMTTLTSLMGLSAENYSRCESKTLGKRSGEDKVELCVKCMRWVMEAAKFAFKLKLHCSGGGIYMQPIWKPSSSGDTLNNLDGELVLLNTLLSLVFLNLQRWWEKVVWDSVCGEEDGNQLSHAVTSQDPTPSLLLYLCICVFVYLCICVFVYSCVCVFVYLCGEDGNQLSEAVTSQDPTPSLLLLFDSSYVTNCHCCCLSLSSDQTIHP